MAAEHQTAAAGLARLEALNRLLLDTQPGTGVYNELAVRFADLRTDLERHAWLEDRVLFPQVLAWE
ncbi:MAG: hemerythrin domain-containing protein [Cytophagales bacterium]|nr:hemerythrin domain-containing protein [Cytophagales bacterium]